MQYSVILVIHLSKSEFLDQFFDKAQAKNHESSVATDLLANYVTSFETLVYL